ncbi:MAG: phytanoyl-CoA dioxygenase family protein [Chloroflexota bacterium]
MVQITDAQKKQFQQEGYLLLENVIPDDLLQILRDECERYMHLINQEMDAKGVDVMGLNHRDKRYFIPMKYKDSEQLPTFLFSELMADVCQATIGNEAYLFLEQYVVKMAEVGMKFSWHQDSGYIDFPHRPYLTCWCTLDDVTEENGTVYILPFSDAGTRERIEHTIDTETNDRVGYHGDATGIPVILPAGSIAAFWSTTLHRSGANTTDSMRRIFLAQYSAEPLLSPDGEAWRWVEPFIKNGEIIASKTS